MKKTYVTTVPNHIGAFLSANRLLAALIADRIPVVTFDLREPSLHEIFVETVGGDSDE